MTLPGTPITRDRGGYLFSFRHDRACGNDAVFSDDGVIHHDGTHANQHPVPYDSTVNDRTMADGYIFTNGNRAPGGGVHNRIVLYI